MLRSILSFIVILTFTSVTFGQITGTDHDFSTQGWGTNEICEPCHTPHNSDLTVLDAPLWNHEVTAATFTVYTSTTLNATVGQPIGASKLCLSCHDGTVALDAFGGNPGTVGNTITGVALLGIDLRNDHPVSFDYTTALATADGGLHDPSTTSSGLPGGGTIDDDLLFAGSLECASCHDVHNGYGHPNLLIIDNAGSDFCLTCHNK